MPDRPADDFHIFVIFLSVLVGAAGFIARFLRRCETRGKLCVSIVGGSYSVIANHS